MIPYIMFKPHPSLTSYSLFETLLMVHLLLLLLLAAHYLLHFMTQYYMLTFLAMLDCSYCYGPM